MSKSSDPGRQLGESSSQVIFSSCPWFSRQGDLYCCWHVANLPPLVLQQQVGLRRGRWQCWQGAQAYTASQGQPQPEEKPASSSSSKEVEPFRALAVPKRWGWMWLGDAARPAFSASELLWSLAQAERLRNQQFPSWDIPIRELCSTSELCLLLWGWPAAWPGGRDPAGLRVLEGSRSGYRRLPVLCQCMCQPTAVLGYAQGLPGCLLCCEKSGVLL